MLLLLLGCCLVRRRRRRKQVARDENGGVEAKADGQPVNALSPVPTDYLLPSTFPATLNIDPSTLPAPVLLWSQRQNGQGKLTESAESMSKAAHRAEINDTEAELAKIFARGAKGTKDGPGRFTSRSGTLPAHNPVQVPSSHPGPGCCSTGVDGTTTMNGASKDCVRCTNGLQASPPVPAMATLNSTRAHVLHATYGRRCARGARPYERPTPYRSRALPIDTPESGKCAKSARGGFRRTAGSARSAPFAGWRGCRPEKGL